MIRVIIILIILTSKIHLEATAINPLLPNIKKEIVGLYEWAPFNCNYSLELKDDGNFIHQIKSWSCFGSGDSRIIKGTYTIEGDSILELNPEILVLKEFMPDSVNTMHYIVNTTDSMTYNEIKDQHLRKKYQIFLWRQSIYLLSDEYYHVFGSKSEDNDYTIFAWQFNYGLHMHKYSYFAKENENLPDIKEFNYSNIPQPYRYLFLNQPIDVQITDTLGTFSYKVYGNYKKTKKVKLNKGKAEDVYVGLTFFSRNCSLKIVSVEEHFSYAIIQNCADGSGYTIGSLFSTKGEY